MPFRPEHWRIPRKTIATRFQHDDLGYATHGAMLAMEAIRRLNIRPSDACKMRLLDYGCGTGRVARIFSGYFGHVVGYDPVAECILAGLGEQRGMTFQNLVLTDMVEPLMREKFDIIVSINVMEHLDLVSQRRMLETIEAVAKPKARLLLWYSILQNSRFLALRFGEHIVAEDHAFLAANPGSQIQVREFRL